MGTDLISRKELIEMIQGSEELLDFQKDECIACIEACDTAYDVEKVIEQTHEIFRNELHLMLKPLPDGTEYPEEAYRLLYLNDCVSGTIRNGGKV